MAATPPTRLSAPLEPPPRARPWPDPQAGFRRASLWQVLVSAFALWVIGRLASPGLPAISSEVNEWLLDSLFRTTIPQNPTDGSAWLGTLLLLPVWIVVGLVSGGFCIAFMLVAHTAWFADRYYLFPFIGAALAFYPELTRSWLTRIAGGISYALMVVFASSLQVFITRGASNRLAALAPIVVVVSIAALAWLYATPSINRSLTGSSAERIIRYLPTSTWQSVSQNSAWRLELTRAELLREHLELTLRCTNRQRRADKLGFTGRTFMEEIDTRRAIKTRYRARMVAGDVPARGLISFRPGQTREVILHLPRPDVFQHRWRLRLGLAQDRGRTLQGQVLFDLRKKAPR